MHIFSQQQNNCNIKNYLSPDGTMYYYVPVDTFYYTETKQLLGGMVTDKEHYFLTLQPLPKPAAIGSRKKYKPLTVTLENDSTFTLDFFDARFVNDTIYNVVYLFDSDKHRAFITNNVKEIKMQTPYIDESFVLKLHKDAIIQHINCLNSIKKIL